MIFVVVDHNLVRCLQVKMIMMVQHLRALCCGLDLIRGEIGLSLDVDFDQVCPRLIDN